jgi:hypothetical protein
MKVIYLDEVHPKEGNSQTIEQIENAVELI